MYFKFKRNSELGKRFQKIEIKVRIAMAAPKKLAKKYGFDVWAVAPFVIGGISCVRFEKEPDALLWKKAKYRFEYSPRHSTKSGKALYNEIKNLPVVHYPELNAAISESFSRKMGPFKHIGFCYQNDKYYGIIINSRWEVPIPEGLTEITETEYKNLSK